MLLLLLSCAAATAVRALRLQQTQQRVLRQASCCVFLIALALALAVRLVFGCRLMGTLLPILQSLPLLALFAGWSVVGDGFRHR
jgi:hypothetical protein